MGGPGLRGDARDDLPRGPAQNQQFAADPREALRQLGEAPVQKPARRAAEAADLGGGFVEEIQA